MQAAEEEKKSSKFKYIPHIKVTPSFIQHVGIFITTLPEKLVLKNENMPQDKDLNYN
jgi:hypothetical protein